MNAMLTKYLKDFSAPPPPPVEDTSLIDSFPSSDFGGGFSFEPEPAIDIEAERQQAHDEGYRQAMDEATTAHQAELAEMSRRHQQELIEMAAAHEQDVVAKIHARFHEMTGEIAQSLADQTLQALLPVFSQRLAESAVEKLYDLIRKALSDREASLLTIRGSASLYEALKSRLEASGVESRFIESPAVDLTVEIDDAVLVTRLETWAQALAEVME